MLLPHWKLLLIKSSMIGLAVYICHLETVLQQIKSAWLVDIPLVAHQNEAVPIMQNSLKYDHNPRNNSHVRLKWFYRHQSYIKTIRLYLNFQKCTLTVEYNKVVLVATSIFGENKMEGMAKISAKYMASGRLFIHRWFQFGNSTRRVL